MSVGRQSQAVNIWEEEEAAVASVNTLSPGPPGKLCSPHFEPGPYGK